MDKKWKEGGRMKFEKQVLNAIVDNVISKVTEGFTDVHGVHLVDNKEVVDTIVRSIAYALGYDYVVSYQVQNGIMCLVDIHLRLEDFMFERVKTVAFRWGEVE